MGEASNARNGGSPKTVITPSGALPLDIPRDRRSTFDPVLVAKHQRRLSGFDDHVISMYARGMSVREVQGHLLELYGLEVSPELISTIKHDLALPPIFHRIESRIEAHIFVAFLAYCPARYAQSLAAPARQWHHAARGARQIQDDTDGGRSHSHY